MRMVHRGRRVGRGARSPALMFGDFQSPHLEDGDALPVVCVAAAWTGFRSNVEVGAGDSPNGNAVASTAMTLTTAAAQQREPAHVRLW